MRIFSPKTFLKGRLHHFWEQTRGNISCSCLRLSRHDRIIHSLPPFPLQPPRLLSSPLPSTPLHSPAAKSITQTPWLSFPAPRLTHRPPPLLLSATDSGPLSASVQTLRPLLRAHFHSAQTQTASVTNTHTSAARAGEDTYACREKQRGLGIKVRERERVCVC